MKVYILTDNLLAGNIVQRGLYKEGLQVELLIFPGCLQVEVQKLVLESQKLLVVLMQNEVNLEKSLTALSHLPKIVFLNHFQLNNLKQYREMFSYCFEKPYNYQKIAFELRMTAYQAKQNYEQLQLNYDSLELSLNLRELSNQQHRIRLTNKEFSLMQYLMINQGKLLTRMEILENVWDINALAVTNTVDVHISKLRKILKTLQISDNLIQTVPCGGYIFGKSV